MIRRLLAFIAFCAAVLAAATPVRAEHGFLPSISGDVVCLAGGTNCVLPNSPTARAHLGAAAAGPNNDLTALQRGAPGATPLAKDFDA